MFYQGQRCSHGSNCRFLHVRPGGRDVTTIITLSRLVKAGPLSPKQTMTQIRPNTTEEIQSINYMVKDAVDIL